MRDAASVPGPHALPTCDYCGDTFLDPKRGYKRGCPKHDPYQVRLRKRELLLSNYGVVRNIVRASHAANVEIALVALDELYALAKETVG